MDVLDLLAASVGCFAIAHLFLPTPAWGNILSGLLIQATMAYLLVLTGFHSLEQSLVASPARLILLWIGVALTLVQVVHLSLSFALKRRRL